MMMKVFQIVLLFSISINAQESFIKSYKIKDFINKVDKKALANEIRVLVEKSGHGRMVGTSGHKGARLHLEERLQKLSKGTSSTVKVQSFKPNTAAGIKMYKDDFQKQIVGQFPPHSAMFKKWQSFTNYMGNYVHKNKDVKGHNIIWENKGKSGKVLIFTAHYDTISHYKESLRINLQDPMPGADYNGSGVAIGLGLVDRLSKANLVHTIRVVFLDYQGLGVLGAEHYAHSIKDEADKVIGVMNLEMLGHDSKAFDKNKKTGNYALYLRDSKDLAGYKQDMELVKIFRRYESKCRFSVRFKVKANGFKSSDHTRFWEKGFSAITFSQDWEDDFNHKRYQTKNDFVETLNQKSLWDSYRTISCMALHWASDL